MITGFYFSWDHNFSPKGNVKVKFVQTPKKIQDVFGEPFILVFSLVTADGDFSRKGVEVAGREAGEGAFSVKKAPSCRLDIFLEQLP